MSLQVRIEHVVIAVLLSLALKNQWNRYRVQREERKKRRWGRRARGSRAARGMRWLGMAPRGCTGFNSCAACLRAWVLLSAEYTPIPPQDERRTHRDVPVAADRRGGCGDAASGAIRLNANCFKKRHGIFSFTGHVDATLSRWQERGFSTRHVLTEALLKLDGDAAGDAANAIAELRVVLDRAHDLLEGMRDGRQALPVGRGEEQDGLTESFIASVRKVARPGFQLD